MALHQDHTCFYPTQSWSSDSMSFNVKDGKDGILCYGPIGLRWCVHSIPSLLLSGIGLGKNSKRGARFAPFHQHWGPTHRSIVQRPWGDNAASSRAKTCRQCRACLWSNIRSWQSRHGLYGCRSFQEDQWANGIGTDRYNYQGWGHGGH